MKVSRLYFIPAARRKPFPGFRSLALAFLLTAPGAHSLVATGTSAEPPPEPDALGREFRSTYTNSMPFSYEAERQGLAVSEAEIDQRMEVFRKLYPSVQIEKPMVRTILLAEAYLNRQDLAVGKEAEDPRVEDLKRQGFQEGAELEEAARALRASALLAREEVRSVGKKLWNTERIRRQLSGPPPKEYWPAAELQIPGDPRGCVAWLGAECFVSVEEFNVAACQVEFLRDTPLDSARIGVVMKYALAKNTAGKPVEGEPEREAREVLSTYKKTRETKRWTALAMDFGIPELDAGALESTYQKYYQRYFRPREDITLALIGSSDSAYIDSLHALMAGWRKNAALREGAPVAADNRIAVKEPVLPWMTLKEEDLPNELVAPTDSFRVGDFTAPIRTSYGHFIVRLSRVQASKEISFPEAQGMLIFLATRDNFLELDSLVELKTRQYYDRNLRDFSLPDTLDLRAWLAPSASGMPAEGKKPSPLPQDTLRFLPMRMNSLDLPEPLRVELQKAVRKEPGKKAFGPFGGPYGRWHFQVRKARRAEGVIPYSVARRAIREKMSVLPRLATDTVTSEQAKDNVFLNLAIARDRSWFLEKKLMEKVTDEWAGRLRNGTVDTTQLPEGSERGARGKRRFIFP